MSVNNMDVKQKCISIIDSFPEEQLDNVFASLEAMYNMLDKIDDKYCLELYNNSLGDDNNEQEDLEDFAAGLGYLKNENTNIKTW